MNKLKNVWGWIVAFVSGLIGLLFFLLSKKNSEINTLKQKVSNIKTEQEADIIEADIKTIKDQKNRVDKEKQEIDVLIDSVDKKREEIRANIKKMTDKQIVDYWNDK